MAERQLVGFVIEKEEYAIDILLVQEIIHKQEIVAVPGSPDFMEGIISIRGKIIPVIDLRKRFGFPPQEDSDSSRIIVLNIQGKTIGIVVDQVSEVLHLSENSISPPPRITISKSKEYIEGIGQLQDRLIIILDIKNLLTSSELSQLDGSFVPAPGSEDIMAASEGPAEEVEPAAELGVEIPEAEAKKSSPEATQVEPQAVTEKVGKESVVPPIAEEAGPGAVGKPVESEVVAEQPVKRKRGRPRKIRTEEELNKPKRPRGRPRKNK